MVPRQAAREPGLILVSADGEVRFLDNVATSLAGQERSQTLQVDLGVGEHVVGLVRAEDSNYVVSTSRARLFSIKIASSGGRLQASITPFNQQRGIFGRLFGNSSTSSLASSEGIVAVAVSPSVAGRGHRDIYAAGQRTVQRWRLLDGGSERLLGEQDLASVIASALSSEEVEDSSTLVEDLGLQIIDAAPRSDGSFTLLYSFTKDPRKAMKFGLATFNSAADQGAFLLKENYQLQHRALRDPRPYSSPRLIIPNGDRAVFVAFPDVLVMTVHSSAGQFEDKITLKDSARNRFLGFGSEGPEVSANQSIAALTCLSAQNGALLVEFDVSAASDYCSRLAEPAHRQAAINDRLHSKLEQAVFFDDAHSSPLSFAVASSFASQADLSAVAEKISSQILASSSRYLQTFVDVRLHLADRLSHLSSLIQAIRDNGLLNLLAHRSRCRLYSDAALLAAGIDLWKLYNDSISRASSSGSPSVPLADAIADVMAGLGLGLGQDAVRLFFRSHMSALPAVFEGLLARTRNAEGLGLDAQTLELVEINRILVTAHQAAARHKQLTAETSYGLEGRLSFEVWTCKAVGIELLVSLYGITEKLIHERTRALGGIIDSEAAPYGSNDAVALGQQALQQELKTQLCELARATLSAYEERVSYLSSGPSMQREQATCLARYRSALPKMIHPLVSIGRTDRAFSLAERHRDFRTIVELCVNPSTGDPSQQIQHYLKRFGQDFAFELYEFYVEQGRFKELLQQDGQWWDLLLAFFEATAPENNGLAWLHDLALKRWHQSSKTLMSEANREQVIKEKNVLLSLGKLAYVANLEEESLATEGEQRKIQLIDDQLDLISVHEKLLALFTASLPERASTDVARKAEIITSTLCQGLSGGIEDEGSVATAPGHFQHYQHLVFSLLQGQVLSSEDLVDLLTLKDVTDDSMHDFVVALEVCLRATDLHSGRLEALVLSLWRRALLSDDWAGIADTRDVSEEQMEERIRGTVWFQTIEASCGNEFLHGLLRPFESLVKVTPAKEVFQARFQGGGGGEATYPVEILYEEMLQREVQGLKALAEEPGVKDWILEAEKKAMMTLQGDVGMQEG